VPGKARLNDMYRAYMESKQRSSTHFLCLLTLESSNRENFFIFKANEKGILGVR